MYGLVESQINRLLVILLLFLAGCTSLPQRSPLDLPSKAFKAYQIKAGPALLNRYAPYFIIENPQDKFNLIGTPSVRMSENRMEEIFVDAELPTIYTEIRHFQTNRSAYTNLFYRIHFEKVPLGFIPFYIGKGKNVGLFIIVTLNSHHEPILYTTVHSCGCYLAFVPTSFMPDDAFPPGWAQRRQTVYGESLPALLDYTDQAVETSQLMVLIRRASHRVKDMWLAPRDSLKDSNADNISQRAMASLTQLALAGQDTETQAVSFFITEGSREGYVKGSHKPWERLLMSWWALDWRIGEDKRLGKNKHDGPVFYTSLKPWARQASDMRDFTNFLDYWGWRL